jgi:hypothetical protein
MIDPEKRKAIYCLHEQGMFIKQIERYLHVDRNTVRKIIALAGEMPNTPRCDKIELDSEMLSRLYSECNGYIERMHEKLVSEHNVKIGYSTLTGRIRELGLGKAKNQRCDQVPDKPGAEMQHDTTVYKVKLGDKTVKVVCSLVYLRYSKMRYVKFYRHFNRFHMKCFLHAALMFWGHSAPVCIIDNTNLARLRGSGRNATMIPEMEEFSGHYAFEFICHEIRHANRKAGNERSFYTVETNFLPGRKFENLQDLNQQALAWATVIMTNRPQSKTGLIPAKAFEYEQGHLNKLPPYVPAPYLEHQRGIDQYGYIAFNGNYYWIPGLKRFDVQVLQYSDCLKIYHQRQMLIEYPLPADGVRNQKFSPPGQPQPRHQPANRKDPTDYEEKKLHSIDKDVDVWLDFTFAKLAGKQKHRLVRQLYDLHQKMSLELFIKTIRRAAKYRITDIHTIENIALLLLQEAGYRMPQVHVDEEFVNRDAFIEGRYTDAADLSVYNHFGENDNE